MDNNTNQNGQENKPKKSKKIPILCTIGGVAAAACIACAVLLPKWQSGSVPASVTGEDISVSETADVQTTDSTTAAAEEENDVPAETLPRETPEDCIVSAVYADKTVGRLIKTDSPFTIATREDMDEDSLKAHLAITPETGFSIEKTGDKSYLLTAAEQFPKGAVVKLALNNDNGGEVYSWAFQTEDDFRLKSYYPDDGSDYVPVDSGIEFEFTAVPDAKKAEEYFSISPEVEGRFMTVRNTLVFVPKGGLKGGRVYNVTLKEGLPSVDGIAAPEGCTFSFKTSNGSSNSYCYASNGDSESFLPDDIKVIEISCSRNMKNSDFSVDLYRYSGAEDYFKALCECADSIGGAYYIRDNYTFDTSKLEKVYSSTEQLMLDENSYFCVGYIMLPEDMQEGWYIADIKTTYQNTEYHIQRHIQVNSLSVYASFLSGEALYFVNDTVTGAAAENADISLYGGGEFTYAKVGSDGTAKADIKGSGKGVMRVNHNGKTFIDFFDYRNDEDIPANEKYYMYLYTDRQMYLSTDTINVWGMIRPRSDKYTVPDDLYISISRGSGEVSDRVYIKPDEKGFFTAKVPLNKNVEGYGNISLYSGDEEMCSKWLRVYDYVKPTYFFDPQLPKYAESPQTNPVPVSFDATFTEGTPAPGVKFTAYSYDTKTERTPVYTTDENGHAEFELLYKDVNTWQPRYTSVEFELDGIENEYQSMWSDILLFYRDVMVETECEKQDKKGIMDITTSMINTKAAEEHDEPYYFAWGQNSDELRGAPYDTEVSVTLVRNWSEKKESGSYYDFLEKRNVTKYTYNYREEVVGTYTVNTVGGKATLELPLEYDDSSYHVNIRYKDSQGRSVTDTEYIYNGRYSSDRPNKHFYTFDMEDTTFTEGQTINISLNDNYEPVENGGGRIFYIFNQENYVYCGTSDNTVVSHKMTAEYIPCVRVSGAYFDGRHVYTVYNYDGFLQFDPEEREYTVSVGSDKDSYKPGEKATVTVRAVTKDGKPAANADVSLSVVDEAAFALADQTADPLGNIYTSVWYPNCDTYCSYVEHSLATNGMGEKGGGDGEGGSVRRDFKDNAAFMTGRTNSDGTAVFTFTLPDNLTEWRCTAQAVGIDGDGRIYAGTSREPLIVSVPFFITTISLPTYTEGDDISVSAISHGDGGTASITAQITGGGVDKTVTAQSGDALNFGKLPIGEYKVLFTAESGGQSDAVELPLSVVGTQLETEITNFYDLTAEKLDITPTRYPVHISFFDKEYLLYSNIVYQLSNCCSGRLDFNIAQGFAFKELGWFTEQEYIKEYGGNSGALKVLPAAQTDLELTALVCGAAPELVEKAPTARTFYNALKERDIPVSTYAVCYYGLASLEEPVLTEIYDFLESDRSISAENGLYLAAALAKLGDTAGAQECYTKYTEALIITDGETGKEAHAASTDLTKTALLAASAMHHPEAEYIARYLYEHPSNVDSYALQLMTYLKHYVPKYEGGAEICYDLNGAEKSMKLDKFRGNCVSFGEEQLKNANIRIKSGEVVCIAMYTGRVSEIKTAPSIGIRKSVSPVNGVWAPGELVRVTIDLSDTKCKYNIVEDVIPSCGRFTSYHSDYFYVRRSGQRIRISAYDRKSLTYYYRLAAVGEFVSEAPTVRDYHGNWGIGESSTITVSEQMNETAV